jgi:hypothetical protein
MTPKSKLTASMEDFQRRNNAWMAQKVIKQYIKAEELLDKESKENTFKPHINRVS